MEIIYMIGIAILASIVIGASGVGLFQAGKETSGGVLAVGGALLFIGTVAYGILYLLWELIAG